MDIQVSLPSGGIVAALQQRARFFRDDAGIDRIEVSAIGSKDTTIRKVTPQDMALFRAEYDAFCDGRPVERRTGTPLTKVDGINPEREDMYVTRNIHNAEELAVLSDAQCQALGHGVLTERKAARALVERLRMEQKSTQHDAVLRAAEKLVPGRAADTGEVAELGKKIDTLAEGINALVGLLSAQAEKKKPGRPPKEK